ncbi:hypothetical protein BRM13313_00199 [Salmonella phage BRM 13313]|nr:hypothetical protein BRM13313_00199 [Salmonella phage BRM 13313]
MNYKRIHDSIISRAVNRSLPSGYTEKHHIIPLSMGGKDRKFNMVVLTASEHYIVHMLLAKMHGEVMKKAFIKMKHLTSNPPNNKVFSLRREMLCTISGDKAKIGRNRKAHSDKIKGRKHTEITKKSISDSMKGVNNPMKGTSPWRNPTNIKRGSHKNWLIADKIYDKWCNNKSVRVIDLLNGNDTQTSYTTVTTMKLKFEAGWVPKEDEDWIVFVKENKHEISR